MATKNHSPRREPTHRDWAEEAEAAERAEDWPQAAALWRKASDTCDDPERRADYEQAYAGCEALIAVDAELASIARRVLRIPTLETRKADHLDFHEVAVWDLLQALRLAYRLGEEHA